MAKKYVFGLIGLLAILTVFAVATISVSPNAMDSAQSLSYHSCVEISKNGIPIAPCKPNLLTNAGKNAIKNALNGGTGSFNYIALCNATAGCTGVDATDVSLDNEYGAGNGLTRASGTYTSIGTGNWTISNTFTALSDNLLTNQTALFNASTSGTMLAENSFNTVTLLAADRITINWTIWVS